MQHVSKPLCPTATESVLRYLVEVEGIPLATAVGQAKAAVQSWHNESSTAIKASFGGLAASGLGILAGGGVASAICIVPAVAALLSLIHSQAEERARTRELTLLRGCPELLQAIEQACYRGLPDTALLNAYDAVVGAFDPEAQACLAGGDAFAPESAFAARLGGMANSYRELQSIHGHAEALTGWTRLHPQPEAPAIGPATRLGAIEAAAAPVDELAALGAALADPVPVVNENAFNPIAHMAESFAAPSGDDPLSGINWDDVAMPSNVETPQDESDEFDLAGHLANKPLDEMKSMITLGESGAGKGVFLYNLKTALLKRFPGAALYGINGKPDRKEQSRWAEGFKHILNVKNKAGGQRVVEIFRHIEKVLETRMDTPSDSPFILIVSEYNTIKDDFLTDEQAQEVAGIVKRIGRQGRSARCWVIIELQSANADEIGMTASDRANFTITALGYKNYQLVLRLATANNFLFPGLPKVNSDIQRHKGKPYGIAVCTDFDRVLKLQTTMPPEATPAKVPVGVASPAVQQLEDAWGAEPDMSGISKISLGGSDAAWATIEAIPDETTRKSVEMGYRWALGRRQRGGDVTRSAWISRAHNSDIPELKDQEFRSQVWNILETLLKSS